MRFKGTSIASRICNKCELAIEENTMHIVMKCPFFENDKQAMFNELNEVDNMEIIDLLKRPVEVFLIMSYG